MRSYWTHPQSASSVDHLRSASFRVQPGNGRPGTAVCPEDIDFLLARHLTEIQRPQMVSRTSPEATRCARSAASLAANDGTYCYSEIVSLTKILHSTARAHPAATALLRAGGGIRIHGSRVGGAPAARTNPSPVKARSTGRHKRRRLCACRCSNHADERGESYRGSVHGGQPCV